MAILFLAVLISHEIRTVNSNGETGKITNYTKTFWSSLIFIRKISLANNCFIFQNYTHILANVHMWIQLPQNRGPLSKDLSILRLIMASIGSRDDSGPYQNTSKEHVDSDRLDPTNNILRFKIEKRHACPFTGFIQFICEMWNLAVKEDASTDQPIYRDPPFTLSRMDFKTNQKYPSRRYIWRL